MPKIALLGVGRIGQVHLNNLVFNQAVDFAGVFDINQELAQKNCSREAYCLFE